VTRSRLLVAFVVTATVAFAAVAVAATANAPARASGMDIYVSARGNDTSSGTTSGTPLKTLQIALNRAVPGSVIHLAPGTYSGDVVTKVNGTALAPITVEGTDTGLNLAKRGETIVTGISRVFSINNSFYHLSGFTIDGEPALKTTVFPSTLQAVKSFKDSIQSKVSDSSLVFIGAADSARGIAGVVINDMALEHAGGDCVRIANGAHNNIIEQSTIQWCGLRANPQPGVYTYHNGEGVYVGTSPKSTDRSMSADDNTGDNLIVNNVINTYGSECFDVKENSHDNTFRNNTCGYNDEPLVYQGSNVEIRGYHNTITGNTIAGSMGYGLKLASDTATDPQGGNVVQGNKFSGDTGNPIDNHQIKAQGSFCGNTFTWAVYLLGASVGSAKTACSAIS
jgi:Right handed beta helix region